MTGAIGLEHKKQTSPLVVRSKTARKWGGAAGIRQLPLFDLGSAPSRWQISYKIALELNRETAALAVMRKAITFKNEEYRSLEENAFVVYYENSKSNTTWQCIESTWEPVEVVQDKEKAIKLLQKNSPLAWVRVEYTKLFDNKMSKGDYLGALNLVDTLNFFDGHRKETAAEALVGQKLKTGLEDDARKVTQAYLWEKDIAKEMSRLYEDDKVDPCLEELAKILSNSNDLRTNVYALKGKRILDIGCGSVSGGESNYPPRLCRQLAYLGADAVGIDLGGNKGELFKNYRQDMAYPDFEFLPQRRLFDAINCNNFLGLNTRKFMEKIYRNVSKYHAITIDGVEFFAGFSCSTSPQLSERYDHENGHETYFRIAKQLFDLALPLLKENGVFLFDSQVFVKKNGQFKYSHDYLEKNPNNPDEHNRLRFFVPE